MATKLVAELVLEVSKMQAGLKRAQRSLARASQSGGKMIGRGTALGIAAGFAQATLLIVAALATVVAGAAAIAGAAAGKTIAKAVKEAAQNEKFQMRFEVLTGSRGAGNRALQMLREDALRTGIALGDMADNVGKFIAFGFTTGEAVDLQRGILDVGGAVGLTNRDMKLLGVALSQVAAKGCHGIDSPIRMHDGSVKMVQEIIPGDKLMGPDGGPRTVRYLARGRQELFKITPLHGLSGEFVVNRDHLARLVIDEGNPVTISIDAYLALDAETQSRCNWFAGDCVVPFLAESIGEGDFYGFNITGDHLYVSADGFEHHNTANMEELRQQIAEKGIPIFKALEQQLGVTGAELSKMVQEGKVGADVVLDLFKGAAKGEGPFERFAGGAEKMASTFLGTIGRIKTSYSEFLRIMGGPIRESLVPILEAVYKHVDGLRAKAEQWGTAVADVITHMTAIGQTLRGVSIRNLGAELLKGFDEVEPALRKFFIKLSNGLQRAMLAAGLKALEQFMDWISGSEGKFDNLLLSAVRVLDKELSAALSRGAANFLRAMSEGMGPILGALYGKGFDMTATFLEGNAEKLDVDAMAAGREFRGEVAKVMRQGMDNLGEQRDAAISGFKSGFDNAGAELVSNIGNLSGGISPLINEIGENFKTLRKKRIDDLAAKDTLIGKEGTFGGAPATGEGGGAAGGGSFGMNGRLAQSINTISGRSAFAVIATEGKKTNEQLMRANKSLEEIAKNTRNKSSRTAAGSPVGPAMPSIFK
jgi:hypothetical protein